MSGIRFKRVMRLDTIQRHFRLFRVMWERGTVGDGNGYSAKLALGLLPRLFMWERLAAHDLLIVLLGVRLHYSRSYGGRFA